MTKILSSNQVNISAVKRPEPPKNTTSQPEEQNQIQTDLVQILKEKRARYAGHHAPIKPEPAPLPAREKPVSVPVMKDVKPLNLMGVDEVRKAYGLTGKNIGVAVIDSGFNYPQEELAGWQDFLLDNSPRPVDPLGHGTIVAGDVKEVAPRAKLIGLRVSDENGTPIPSALIKAMQWVLENKEQYNIKVINLSLGIIKDPLNSDSLIEKSAEKLVDAGILVVCSAGNEGPLPSSIRTVPNDNPKVLTVGGAEDQTTLCETTSRGPAENGGRKPDLVAPGSFIKSWAAPDSVMLKDALQGEKVRAMGREEIVKFIKNPEEMVKLGFTHDFRSLPEDEQILRVKNAVPKLFLTPQGRIVPFEGTSFSSPLVAGVAALLMEAKPDLTPKEIMELLTHTAKKMPGYGENDRGAGFIDAKAAVDELIKTRKNSSQAKQS